MFSCVLLHFKKYFLVFGCVLENTIENTFSTCCSHFLTFSQLPNKYIISFLNTETQKKQNSGKKFIKSGQYRNTKETKPRKKIHQIPSNWEKKEEREATRFDLEARSCGRCEGKIEWCWSRSLLERCGVIGAVLRSTRLVRLARCCDRRDRWSVGRRIGARSKDWALSSSSLSLSLSLSLSVLRVSSEMV